MYLENIQNKLVLKAALLMFIVTLAATILRPLIATQSWLFTAMGSFNAVLLGALWLYLRSQQIRPWHKVLVVGVGFCSLIPLMAISGGVNSQFTSVLPCVPFFICLMISPRAAWLSTAFMIALMIVLISASSILPDISEAPQPLSKTYARGFWLSLACVLSSAFASGFYQINQTLGEKLRTQAFQDELTGIANRRSIIERLNEDLLRPRDDSFVLSVLMLDVDHFKNINDTYGHSIGDKCLKAIAQTLQKNVRKDNDRVGRYGGEEFLILLPQTDPEAAALIAEHLRQEVKKISFTELGDTGLHLSVTIGLASLQLSQHKDAETLISEADQALYKGKQSGRDQVVAATV